MDEEILERHRAAVFARLRRSTSDDAEAEDLTQETLLRAHLKLHTLKDGQASLAWLFRIADRLRIDRLRRRDPLRETTDWEGAGLPDEAPTAIERAERFEMSDCTRNYVERLKPSHRQVLQFHDVEGRSLREVAAALGVSVGAAKIRLHRARANLRRLLGEACRFSHDERGVFVCEPMHAASTEPAAGEPYPFAASPRPLGWTGAFAPQTKETVMTPKEKELIALAASVAAGCESCTQYHAKAARENGARDDGLARMIEIALCVRERATQRMASVAWKELGKDVEPQNCGCSEPPSRLEALASAASALAANCGAGVGGFLDLALRAGADERDGLVALGIARQIRKVAAEKAEAASRGEDTSAPPCGCAAVTAESKGSGACC